MNLTTLLKLVTKAFSINMLAALLAFGTHLVLARLLPPPEYGTYMVLLSWLMLLTLTSRLGLDNVALKFVPRYDQPEHQGLRNGLLLAINALPFFLCLLAGLILYFTSDLLIKNPTISFQPTLLLMLLTAPIFNILLVNSGFLRGLGSVTTALLPQKILLQLVIFTAAAIALVGLLAWSTADRIMFARMIGTSLALSTVLIAIARRARPNFAAAPPTFRWRTWLESGASMMLINGFMVTMRQADIILVGYFRGPTEAAIYGVCSRMVRLSSIGLNACSFVTAPLISKMYQQNDRQALQKLLKRASLLQLLYALPIFLLLYFAGHWLLPLFGNNYANNQTAAQILAILAIGQFAVMLAGNVGFLMTMTHMERQSLMLHSTTAALNVALNFFLIPSLGSIGAAIVTTICLFLFAFGGILLVNRELKLKATCFGL